MSRAFWPLAMTDVTSLSGGRDFCFADESIDWMLREVRTW